MNRETKIQEYCDCGISEETGQWSEAVFDQFGCTCGYIDPDDMPDIEERES